MVGRFGQVVYWACNALAVCVFSGIVYWHMTMGNTDPSGSMFFGAIGIVVFMFGRACLYVLAGR